MSNYAILSINGTQQKVSVGDVVRVRGEVAGDSHTFEQVLAIGGDTVTLGSPFVNNAKVVAKVGDTFKGDKVRVAMFKAKSKYHRVRGHRDLFTEVTITDISA